MMKRVFSLLFLVFLLFSVLLVSCGQTTAQEGIPLSTTVVPTQAGFDDPEMTDDSFSPPVFSDDGQRFLTEEDFDPLPSVSVSWGVGESSSSTATDRSESGAISSDENASSPDSYTLGENDLPILAG